MDSNSDKPITNIASYRLDIYRLLTLLLADEQIAKNKIFKFVGYEFFEDEVNRLLILIAAISRRLLDNHKENKIDNPELINDARCGKFQCKQADYQNLTFKKACNMIIHATEILIY